MFQRFLLCSAFLVLLASPAVAASEVLLPADSGGGFNLGLTPKAAAPAASDTTKNAAPAPADAAPAPAALPSLSNDSALPATPIPAAASAVPGDGLHFPTQVIDEPGPGPDLTKIKGAKLPAHHVGVDISAKSVWGNADIAAITDKLGIPGAQVPSQCRLSLNGILLTDGTPAILDTAGAPHGDAYYDGNLTSVMISARALCDAQQLPPNSGYIIRSAGHYAVPLGGGISCPTPIQGRAPSAIQVQYNGNGGSDCRYQ